MMMDVTPQNIALWSKMGPTGVLGLAAMELGATNEAVFFLTADLGVYSGLSRFAASYPDRYINTGIAEQNMIGIAAGLAAEGCTPIATTYATFLSMRAADQVRVCMGEMKLPIKLVGTGAGLSTGILGATHMGLEDISLFRTIPGITVLSPADATETGKALIAAAEHPGPVYIRLTGAQNQPPVYKENYNFGIGKAIQLREGKDVAFLATGSMVDAALKAADLLAEQGISAGVTNMHTIAPLDEAAVRQACAARLLVTVEEHSVVGGLGSAVAEILAEGGAHPPLLRIGLTAYPHAAVYEQLLQQQGLTPEGLTQRVQKALGGC